MKQILGSLLGLLLAFLLGVLGVDGEQLPHVNLEHLTPQSILTALTSPQGWYGESYTLEEVPEYDAQPYVCLEGNIPSFTPEELTAQGREEYAPLDLLGRCGSAFAVVGRETMPTQERGPIGQVKPSGWHLAKYDCVDGKYLYNRCHLIGYQLTGENANVKNLITGTRYLNVEGMLPFENEVAEYVEKTGNHVAYRVTPVFREGELLARGVVMQGQSVEDEGAGVRFHVFVYNVQPGVELDYATGDSRLAQSQQPQEKPQLQLPQITLPEGLLTGGESQQESGEMEADGYVINRSSGRFHRPACEGAVSMSALNRLPSGESRETLIAQGYVPCGQCKP